jgi:hypothetical protein
MQVFWSCAHSRTLPKGQLSFRQYWLMHLVQTEGRGRPPLRQASWCFALVELGRVDWSWASWVRLEFELLSFWSAFLILFNSQIIDKTKNRYYDIQELCSFREALFFSNILKNQENHLNYWRIPLIRVIKNSNIVAICCIEDISWCKTACRKHLNLIFERWLARDKMHPS